MGQQEVTQGIVELLLGFEIGEMSDAVDAAASCRLSAP